MTRIISIFNQSGGVGKTTVSMNLAYHLVKLSHKVLLVDMDPQASLTAFMGLKPFKLTETIKDALLEDKPLPIQQDLFGIDLAPTNIYLSESEPRLYAELRREYRLKEILERDTMDYDFVIIDCPPSLALLSVMSLVAATELLIPIQTEYKAVEGTMFLLNTISNLIKKVNRELVVLGALPTMYDDRTKQNRTALNTINQIFEQLKVFPNFENSVVYQAIPRRTDFANAAGEHMPLALYAPKHDALEPLLALAKSISEASSD